MFIPGSLWFQAIGFGFLWVEGYDALIRGAAEAEISIAQGEDEGTVDKDIYK